MIKKRDLKDYEDIPVYVFFTKENTIDLCLHSIDKLGLKNIKLIEGDDGFSQKYLRFINDAFNQESDVYIRTDADRICFEGLLDCVDICINNKDTWVEGLYFDYFMNKKRGGTPHIVPRKAIEYLKNNPSIIKNSLKPESEVSAFLKSKKIVSFKHENIITNLHDWYQLPSKICNTFLTRMNRNHFYLYDLDHIKSLEEDYVRSWNFALKIFNNQKRDMNYINFDFLDENYTDIIGNDEKVIQEKFKILSNVYDSLTSN